MNFSCEEIFSMYGQFDKFVSIEFTYNSEEYRKFGFRLMGTFLFTLEERVELEKLLQNNDIPRTDRKIKFKPSRIAELTDDQKTDLDKNGILASSIDAISTLNTPKFNRFLESGTKEIQNTVNIKAPSFNGWKGLNQFRFGFLHSRHSKGQAFSPRETIQYWAFRIHYNHSLEEQDYKNYLEFANDELRQQVRLEELRLKYQELTINEEEIKEFVKLVIDEIQYKNQIIDAEINRSTERISTVAENYGEELESLKKICKEYDERVIAFGEKIIFLEFERFVHIYARHVAETQIGERFAIKSVFQYKFEDIIRVIKLVIESINKEIQAHFKATPEAPFRRMGKRSVYFDGHYYRIEIEPTGSLKDFHPYNDERVVKDIVE